MCKVNSMPEQGVKKAACIALSLPMQLSKECIAVPGSPTYTALKNVLHHADCSPVFILKHITTAAKSRVPSLKAEIQIRDPFTGAIYILQVDPGSGHQGIRPRITASRSSHSLAWGMA